MTWCDFQKTAAAQERDEEHAEADAAEEAVADAKGKVASEKSDVAEEKYSTVFRNGMFFFKI